MKRLRLPELIWGAVGFVLAAASCGTTASTVPPLPPLHELPAQTRPWANGADILPAQRTSGRLSAHPLAFELPLPAADEAAAAAGDDAPDESDGPEYDSAQAGAPVVRSAGLPRRSSTASEQADEAAEAKSAQQLEGPPVPLAPVERLSLGKPEGSSADAPTDDKPITLHFRDAKLPDVLDAFARFTGLNIVASERVRGTVSLRLNHVPWRAAFDTLLEVNGLAMARRGNVIWVAPVAELAARERQRFEAHARAADLEPLLSRTFLLRYPRAEDVQKLLTAAGAQRVLSRRGAATADARTNLLFVTDLAARLEQVAGLISAIDQPSRQVFIEARIVEGARGFSRELGARLAVRRAGAGPGEVESPGLAGGTNGLVHDLAAQAISGFEAATAGLTLFAAGATRLVTAELSALEGQGRGQIVSSPRVVTADRVKASVEQGTELPYQTKIRSGVSGIQFRRATLKLDVEPQIVPNGRVILDLDIAKDSVGAATAAGPAIDTKRVRTRVEVDDGGTVLIGGIYETQGRDDVTRVPVLGKIPLLGVFFRHRAQHERASELAVFITPRVVNIE